MTHDMACLATSSLGKHGEAIEAAIARFGAPKVYEAWLDVHGYPPTWNPPTVEAIRLIQKLAGANSVSEET